VGVIMLGAGYIVVVCCFIYTGISTSSGSDRRADVLVMMPCGVVFDRGSGSKRGILR
jgi:hypothetical protein